MGSVLPVLPRCVHSWLDDGLASRESSEIWLIMGGKTHFLYWWVLLLALFAAQSLSKLAQLLVRRMCMQITATGPPRGTATEGCLMQWVPSLLSAVDSYFIEPISSPPSFNMTELEIFLEGICSVVLDFFSQKYIFGKLIANWLRRRGIFVVLLRESYRGISRSRFIYFFNENIYVYVYHKP